MCIWLLRKVLEHTKKASCVRRSLQEFHMKEFQGEIVKDYAWTLVDEYA